MKYLKTYLQIATALFLISVGLSAQSLPVPSTWETNVNGYTGLFVVQQFDQNTNAISGTILNTPFSGFMIDRHIQFYRAGTKQMYDGWVLDPNLGAHGQPYYDGTLVISGLVSEGKGGIDGVYPWSATIQGGSIIPPVAGVINLNPDQWTGHKNGQGMYSQGNNELCIESMNPGGSWFSIKRTYGFDNDYTVEFDVKLNTANNHFPILYSDGFVFVDIDWGTDIGHAQPGASYNLRNNLANLEVGKWHGVKVMAYPSKGTFDLYLDGRKLSTATGIVYPLPHHTNTTKAKLQGDSNVIWLGDADDSSYLGGAYNRGNVCWRNIRVTGASGMSGFSQYK